MNLKNIFHLDIKRSPPFDKPEVERVAVILPPVSTPTAELGQNFARIVANKLPPKLAERVTSIFKL